VFGDFLRALIAIHDYYQARGEILGGVVGERFGRSDIYEATVSRPPQLFNVKVTLNEREVHELAREEV